MVDYYTLIWKDKNRKGVRFVSFPTFEELKEYVKNHSNKFDFKKLISIDDEKEIYFYNGR